MMNMEEESEIAGMEEVLGAKVLYLQHHLKNAQANISRDSSEHAFFSDLDDNNFK